MSTFRLVQRKLSGPMALFFFLSTLLSACGGPTTTSENHPTADTKMVELFERAWPTDSARGIDAMLAQDGFTAATDQLMPLFHEGSEIGVLVPYETTDDRNAAIAIIEDSTGIHVSAALIGDENYHGLNVAVTWNDGAIKMTPISSSDEENPDGTVASHWCYSDWSCCFWGCMLGACGFSSLVCLWAGPGFWVCLLGTCGGAAYGCWYGCD